MVDSVEAVLLGTLDKEVSRYFCGKKQAINV